MWLIANSEHIDTSSKSLTIWGGMSATRSWEAPYIRKESSENMAPSGECLTLKFDVYSAGKVSERAPGVDTTIIESAVRPRGHMEVMACQANAGKLRSSRRWWPT